MLFKLPEKKCSGKRRYISVFCKIYSFIMICYTWNTLFFLSKFRHGHQRVHGRLLSDKELPMLSTKTSQKWAKRTYTSTIHIFLPISTIFSNFFFHLLHLLMIFANNCLVKAVIFDPTLSLLHDRESRRVAREQCVLADRDGAICRITLEERAISDLTIFPPEV